MNAGRCCAWITLACLLAGCRSDANRELLERELRVQEDHIYQLQGEIHHLATSLEASRQENDLLKQEVRTPKGGAPEELPAPSRRTKPPAKQPPAELPLPGELAPPAVTPGTEIEPGIEVDPGLKGGPSIEIRPGEKGGSEIEIGPEPGPAPKLDFGTPDQPEPEPAPPQAKTRVEEGNSTEVVNITFNPRLTGGYDADGKDGDEGITVLIEPRDAEGLVIKAPADVSVVLVDPRATGAAGRVARWDFRTDEIVHNFQQNMIGQGIYLKLLWPDARPGTGRYRIYARYTTADGRRLETYQDVTIQGGDDSSTQRPTAAGPTLAEAELSAPRPLRSVMRENAQPLPAAESARPAASNSRPKWSPYR